MVNVIHSKLKRNALVNVTKLKGRGYETRVVKTKKGYSVHYKRKSVGRKNMTYKQLKRSGCRMSPNGDRDRDGVINRKDCRPLNFKRQGRLHDMTIARLKRKEQELENKRLLLLKKLESKNERLDIKTAISSKKLSIKQAKMKQKQAIIDEINQEKAKVRQLEKVNRQAKAELFKGTPLGKATVISKKALEQTRKYVRSPAVKKKINKFTKFMEDLYNDPVTSMDYKGHTIHRKIVNGNKKYMVNIKGTKFVTNSLEVAKKHISKKK